jgi:hypothetical protein
MSALNTNPVGIGFGITNPQSYIEVWAGVREVARVSADGDITVRDDVADGDLREALRQVLRVVYDGQLARERAQSQNCSGCATS